MQIGFGLLLKRIINYYFNLFESIYPNEIELFF